MKKQFTKGKANAESLSDRMKKYESVTTGFNLVERIPVYVRIDQRSGHSWCRDLNKPFDTDYANAMKRATSYMVEKTGAALGFCQSDECSLCYKDSSKLPFETRLFKIQSVFASMFTAAFIKACVGTKLWRKIESGNLPSFDCRCCNVSSIQELANMVYWRSRDSVKNSITLLALEHFSNKEIHKKNGNDKILMLKDRGIDYFDALSEDQRTGAFFRRELYEKTLSEDELSKIPRQMRPPPDESGFVKVVRSRIVQFYIGMPLSDVQNREGVLFNGEKAVKRG